MFIYKNYNLSNYYIMSAIITVNNNEVNELIYLLYGDRPIILNNEYPNSNFIDLTKDNVEIV